MKNGKLILKSSLLLLLFLFIITLYNKVEGNNISNNYAIKLLNSGDIIFRKETNFISDSFSKIDDSIYSHIGIIIKEENKIYVYHIESDEKENDLKKDEISYFLRSIEKFSVYRLKKRVDETKLNFILKQFIDDNIKFDFLFSLSKDKFYCTEFVNEVYLKLLGNDIYVYLFNFNGKEVISINSILKNTDLEKIF